MTTADPAPPATTEDVIAWLRAEADRHPQDAARFTQAASWNWFAGEAAAFCPGHERALPGGHAERQDVLRRLLTGDGRVAADARGRRVADRPARGLDAARITALGWAPDDLPERLTAGHAVVICLPARGVAWPGWLHDLANRGAQ
ncbi:hypothetical protein [Frankia sp. Cppng1_Ct_nod]|uniref:hypothetical protein n=1 Tax=Frankia sp. Cppng1_Ct_nod TaxID=2897162 RepID=UPI001041519C|nr:hypothetical protein [Frankia sp. Cppng1_Ct_nod]